MRIPKDSKNHAGQYKYRRRYVLFKEPSEQSSSTIGVILVSGQVTGIRCVSRSCSEAYCWWIYLRIISGTVKTEKGGKSKFGARK